MNLRQLEIFLAVVRQGSFTGAADKLPMAQPAVSLSIHKLENSLGARLFIRDRSGATLTDEGRVLVRHAEAILRQVVEHASARLHAKVQVAMEVETVPLIVGLAEHGVGVATLLDKAADAHAGQIARLALPTDARIDIALCRRRQVPLSRAGEALWMHLRGGSA